MMYWGNGMSGWAMALMAVNGLLFWGLIIAGVVLLVRSTGRGGQPGAAPTHTPTRQEVLADRFARGAIDEDEYARRLQVLGSAAPSRPAGR